MPKKKKFDLYQKRKFCRVLSQQGNKAVACKSCGIAYVTFCRHYNADPQFAKDVDLAMEEAGDMLEAEAIRRAVSGVEVAVRDKDGIIIGHDMKYSDRLLTLLLKAAKPEKFSDKAQVTHTGAVDHRIEVNAKNELLEKFNKILDITPKKEALEVIQDAEEVPYISSNSINKTE